MSTPSIGEIFRETRKKKGISEETAAKILKIKVERLRDLEDNCYDQFSAHVYARSFVRHYSEYLGLDAADLLQRFIQENPPPPPKPIFEITENQRNQSPVQRHVPAQNSVMLTATGRTVLIAGLLIILLVAGSMWWIARHQTPVSPTPADAPFNPPPPTEASDPIPDSSSQGDQAPTPDAPATIAPPVLSTNLPPADVSRKQ